MIIKGLVIIAFLAGYIIIEILYGDKTKYGKGTLSKCEDPLIEKAFNGLNITGVDFMEELLKKYKKKNYKIKVNSNKSGYGASVTQSKKVILDNDFTQKLSIQTFESCLHELKHVIDEKIALFKVIPGNIFLIYLTILFSRIIVQTLFGNIRYVGLINSYSTALILVAAVSLLTVGIAEIILETRAIKNVIECSNEYLNEFGFPQFEISRIHNYLDQRSKNILKWYPAASIQTVLVFSIFLSFLA